LPAIRRGGDSNGKLWTEIVTPIEAVVSIRNRSHNGGNNDESEGLNIEAPKLLCSPGILTINNFHDSHYAGGESILQHSFC
jgi:hypothetical protein